jgi:hypothetical protein
LDYPTARYVHRHRLRLRMRIARNVMFVLIAAVVLFVAYRLVVLTQSDELLWFVIDRSGALVADGRPAEGWLHRESKGRFLLVTRNRHDGRRQSYLITFPPDQNKTYVQSCGNWTAPQFPLFPFLVRSSEFVLCLGWQDVDDWPAFWQSQPPDQHVVVGAHSVRFIVEDGNAVLASWK